MASSAQFLAAARVARLRQVDALKRSVDAIAERGVQLVRGNIPPGASPLPGMPNHFPGYAATGRMKSQFRRTPAIRQGDTVRAVVRAEPSTPLMARIMVVHERGAVIVPRRAPFLVFKIQGRWVRTKRVRIRPKRYFASAYLQLRREAPERIRFTLRYNTA